MTVGDGLAVIQLLAAPQRASQRLSALQLLSAPRSSSQCLTMPHCASQLLTPVRWLWLLMVGDAWTVNAGSARDLLFVYLILGVPGSWG